MENRLKLDIKTLFLSKKIYFFKKSNFEGIYLLQKADLNKKDKNCKIF